MVKYIYDQNTSAICFFRSTVPPPEMKILLQITERCNLKCVHCFVNSNEVGNELAVQDIQRIILPKLISSNVRKVTLTGGEPLYHKDILAIIKLLCDNNISISICTNGCLISKEFLEYISDIKNIHFNVSLDGLKLESHGRFRGGISKNMFNNLLDSIQLIGKAKLLNGILTTPNIFSSVEEYINLCKYAQDVGANYILMNPLTPFGRGKEAQSLAISKENLILLKKNTASLITDDFNIVYIRFPNDEKLPLGKCYLGSTPYIFTNGDIAICPYIVFAANNPDNSYSPKDFLIGNIYRDINLKECIANYRLPKKIFRHNIIEDYENNYLSCLSCSKGCYAVKVSNNQSLDDCEHDFCPNT